MARGNEGQVKAAVTGADVLTALRLPLAALFPFVRHPGGQLAVVALVAGTDFADGVLARRFGGSPLGAVLDPIADKAFMAVAFVTLASRGLLEWFDLVGVLLRDILAVFGFVVTGLAGRAVALPARAGGKAVTVSQILTLVALIAGSPLGRPLAWATAVLAVYATWDYGRAAARAAAPR